MKVYVAGNSIEYRRIQELMDGLEDNGIQVTRRWDQLAANYYQNRARGVTGKGVGSLDMSEQEARRIAMDSLADVYNSNIFVLDYGAWQGCFGRTGGKWVELGYALAASKPVIVFVEGGEVKTNFTFCFLPQVEIVVGRQELVARLKELVGIGGAK